MEFPPSRCPRKQDAIREVKSARLTPKKIILLLFLGAFAVRVVYIIQIRSNPFFARPTPGTDMFRYDGIARRIASGDFRAGTTAESPLYPYAVLPAIYTITRGDPLWTRIIQAALASFTVVLVYLLARRLAGKAAALPAGETAALSAGETAAVATDETTAVAAAAIAALYPPFIIYDCELLGEWLLNLLCVGMMLFLCTLSTGTGRGVRRDLAVFMSSFLVGLASAAKPTVLVFLPVAAVPVGLYAARSRMGRRRCALLFALGFAASIVPFMVRSYLLSGELVPLRGNSGIMFLMGNNPTATGAFTYPSGEIAERFRELTRGKSQAEADRVAFRLAFDFIRHNPGQALGLYLRKLRMFWSPEEIGNNISIPYFRQISFLRWLPGFGLILPAAVVGAVLALRRFRRFALVYAFVLIYAVVIASFIVVARYRLAVVPFLIIFAGVTVSEFVRLLADRRWKRAVLLASVVLAAGVLLNWEWIYRRGYPVLLRLSGRKCIRRRRGDRILIRTDSGRLGPYAVLLRAPNEMLRKTLHLRPRDLEGLKDADLLIVCKTTPATEWTVSINGVSLQGRPAGPGMRVLRIPVGTAALRPGENSIVLRPAAGTLAVALDDYFHFGRTALYEPVSGWRTERLDTHTYLRARSLHVPNGEAAIVLELRKLR